MGKPKKNQVDPRVYDLAVHMLKDVNPLPADLEILQTELAEAVQETCEDFISAHFEADGDDPGQ